MLNFINFKLFQVSLNSEKYTSILKGLHNAVALDYHYDKKLIFWAEVMLDSIRVANVNGSNITGNKFFSK